MATLHGPLPASAAGPQYQPQQRALATCLVAGAHRATHLLQASPRNGILPPEPSCTICPTAAPRSSASSRSSSSGSLLVCRSSFYGGSFFRRPQQEEDAPQPTVMRPCSACGGSGSCTCRDCSGSGRLTSGGYNKRNRVDMSRVIGGCPCMLVVHANQCVAAKRACMWTSIPWSEVQWYALW